MDDWINFIGNYGFPIALSAYLLLRFETKIDRLTESIVKLTEGVNDQKSRPS